MPIKTSDSHYYVEILRKGGDLFSLATILGIATGKKRTREDGEVEAEFICINKGSNCSKIWATKEELLITNKTINN